MITQFGQKLRNLRTEKNELLKHMADKLEVSSAFLSAIEFGDKNIPRDLFQKLVTVYSIPEDERADWEAAIEQSAKQVKINLQNSSGSQRTAALVFAREFRNLNDSDAEIILRMFSKGAKNNGAI